MVNEEKSVDMVNEEKSVDMVNEEKGVDGKAVVLTNNSRHPYYNYLNVIYKTVNQVQKGDYILSYSYNYNLGSEAVFRKVLDVKRYKNANANNLASILFDNGGVNSVKQLRGGNSVKKLTCTSNYKVCTDFNIYEEAVNSSGCKYSTIDVYSGFIILYSHIVITATSHNYSTALDIINALHKEKSSGCVITHKFGHHVNKKGHHYNQNTSKVKKLTDKSMDVYDITVEGGNNFFANDILVSGK